jgi:hypothetical protein
MRVRGGRVLLVVAAAAVGGCGHSGAGGAPKLAWDGKPIVVRQPEAPADVIVAGRLSNRGSREFRISAADVKLLDDRGSPVRSTVVFAAGATHPLYPPGESPKERPRKEQERLGKAATIEPGKSVPLTVAWRQPKGTRRPVRVQLGAAAISLP